MDFYAFMSLLFGGIFVAWAVYGMVKYRSIPVIVLSFGAAFLSLGVLGSMGLIAREWLRLSGDSVIGIGLILSSISALYSPPSPSFPKWTQWATLVLGVGFVLSAFVSGVSYYWS